MACSAAQVPCNDLRGPGRVNLHCHLNTWDGKNHAKLAMFERLNTFWQVLCYQTIDAFSVIPLCSELVPITTKTGWAGGVMGIIGSGYGVLGVSESSVMPLLQNNMLLTKWSVMFKPSGR